MAWYIPVLLRILMAHICAPWVMKKMVSLPQRTTRFLLTFAFAAIGTVAIGLMTNQLYHKMAALILGLGFLNGLAAYCQWRATDISLTKTSVFTFWDDIIALGLGLVILGESQFFNWKLALGLCVALVSVVAYARHDYLRAKASEKSQSRNVGTGLRFYFYVGAYSVIWGVAIFMFRWWGLSGVPLVTFMANWYTGAMFAALLIFFYYRDPSVSQQTVGSFRSSNFLLLGMFTVCMVASMALGYAAYERAPVSVVQPIFLVAEMILPALIGLFGFGERKNLCRKEICLITSAFLGGALVALSYVP